MRSDMGRVVIERPRSGSRSCSSPKARWYGRIVDGDWDGPTRLKMAMYHGYGYFGGRCGDKNFTDVLGPIEGYLKKHVGQPWNDVYSELVGVLGKGSYPIRHVLYDHILRPLQREYGDFKIDEAGVLRYDRIRLRYRYPATPDYLISIKGDEAYVRCKGIWYQVVIDNSKILTGLKIMVDGYTTPRYVTFKRQIGRKELREKIYPVMKKMAA